ncbi:MAG: hypothetical protein C4583_04160 [Anaerolineaceae bacterium]|nr:MAG: hypothetical protein C4583_04160 [Anaerolineaceae bacterium]
MNIEYRQEYEPELTAKVRARFADEMNRLRAFGFSDFGCYSELLPNYSLFTHFIIFLLAKANREIIRVESPLRLVMSQPLLVQREQSTYALVFGMGVKFYTLFTDGTGLISANFPSRLIQDMQRKLYKYAQPCSLDECWRAHQSEILSFQQRGLQLDVGHSFEKYVAISRREELA